MCYFRQRSGIDYVINPELEVAEEILYLLQLPSAVNLQPFMDGSVLLLELNITEHHPLAGMSLYEMRKNFGVSVLVATVTRGNKTFVPRGNFVLQPEDEISVLAPSGQMEKLLFASDELTGLIGAAALMRPSKSCSDMELKSLKKKYKDKKFAAGCSREVIQQGADMLGLELDELLQKTLDAMKSLEA